MEEFYFYFREPRTHNGLWLAMAQREPFDTDNPALDPKKLWYQLALTRWSAAKKLQSDLENMFDCKVKIVVQQELVDQLPVQLDMFENLEEGQKDERQVV